MAAANGRTKWTQEMRRIVYARLVMQFGPYSSWGKSTYPDGRKPEFDQVLEQLASYLSRLTGKPFEASAVEAQVRWGMTIQSPVQDGLAHNWILNKAAALETGFIDSSDLPSHLQAVHVS